MFQKRVAFILAIVFVLVLAMANSVVAAPGINQQINFQGKVVNKTTGTNVSDGSYNFVFRMYTAASGGAAIWTESKSLTVTNGIFQTNLGDVTSLPGSVDFNTDTIYLGIEYNSDGEMSPRIRFTAVPYAFNAAKVAGLTVTNTTGTLTIANGKTVSFADAFTTSGAFPLTFTTTNSTSLTLPTTGTLSTLGGAENLTNKTIGSTGLIFSGASTDITTASGEDLVLDAAGSGNTQILDNLTIGTGKALIMTGGAGDPTATTGTFWYDTTANKFKIVENGVVKTLCNLDDLGCGPSGRLSGLQAANATNTIDNTNFTQTWNWSTLSSGTGFALNANALTSGALLAVNSAATANMTGSVASFGLTDGTGASSNTGAVVTVQNSGTANANTTMLIQHNATGTNNLAFRVNDQAGDTSPFVIDGEGRVGIRNSSPDELLSVGSEVNRGVLGVYGDMIKESMTLSRTLSTINDVFIYDTTRDTDGGRWTGAGPSQALSWYTETADNTAPNCVVATDDRCGRPEFPQKAVIVSADDALYIFNANDNSMWMKFTQDGTYALGANTNNNPSGIYALNGVVYVGTNGASGTGLYAIDFVNDRMYRFNSTNRVQSDKQIGQRNTTNTYATNATTTMAIADTIVNDVHGAVQTGSTSTNAVNGITLIAVATDTALSVINLTAQNTFSYSEVAGDDYNAVFVTRRGRLYGLNETQGQAEMWLNIDVDQASELAGTPDKWWDETTTPQLSKNAPTISATSPDALEVIERGSLSEDSSDLIYVGTNQGLTEIHDNVTNTNSGWSKQYTTTYQTALMPATIRGMFLFNETSGNLQDSSFRSNQLFNRDAPTYSVQGARGTALTFNGTSDHICSTNAGIACEVDTDFNFGSTGFTISLWFKHPTTMTGTDTLIERRFTTAPAAAAGWAIYMNSTGTITFAIDDDAVSFPDDSATSTQAYNDNQWHHLVAVRQNAGNIFLYIDGKLVGSDTAITATGALGTTAVMGIGSSCSTGASCLTGANFWDGQIDDIVLSGGGATTTDQLTATQVRRLYNDARSTVNKDTVTVTDATTFSTTTIGDSAETWTANNFVGQIVEITGGTGSGQTRRITSNTSTTLTITPAWDTTPDATSDFRINAGTLYGATNTVTAIGLTDSAFIGEARKVFVGTNDGANGGGITLLERAGNNVVTDSYHAHAGKTDEAGVAWPTNGDDIEAIGSNAVAVAMGSRNHYWLETEAQSFQAVFDRTNNNLQTIRGELIADGLTASSLEIGQLGGADLAEYYYSATPLVAGQVVMLDPQGVGWVKPSYIPYQNNLLGVVATAPGMILGPKADNTYPIALVGRVPVKVTTENGMPQIGDRLVASSIPGVAMKATKAGQVVGQVIEQPNSELFTACTENASWQCGELTMFVNLGQGLGMPIDQLLGEQPADTTIYSDPLNTINQTAFGYGLSGIQTSLNYAMNTATEQITSVAIGSNRQEQILAYLRRQGQVLAEKQVKEKSAAGTSEVLTDRVYVTQEIISPLMIADLLLAKEIRADKIVGLDIVTNKISSLEGQLQASLASSSGQIASLSGQLTFTQSGLDGLFDTMNGKAISFGSGEVSDGFTVKGGLTSQEGLNVGGPAEFKSASDFRGNAFFHTLVEFVGSAIFKGKVEFNDRVVFNADTAGMAIVKKGVDTVEVTFDQAYSTPPLVNATVNLNEMVNVSPDATAAQQFIEQQLLNGDITYIITGRTANGFTIKLSKPAPVDIPFSWSAVSVRKMKVFESAPTPTPLQLPTPQPLITPVVSPTGLPGLTTTPTAASSSALNTSISPTSGAASGSAGVGGFVGGMGSWWRRTLFGIN